MEWEHSWLCRSLQHETMRRSLGETMARREGCNYSMATAGLRRDVSADNAQWGQGNLGQYGKG